MNRKEWYEEILSDPNHRSRAVVGTCQNCGASYTEKDARRDGVEYVTLEEALNFPFPIKCEACKSIIGGPVPKRKAKKKKPYVRKNQIRQLDKNGKPQYVWYGLKNLPRENPRDELRQRILREFQGNGLELAPHIGMSVEELMKATKMSYDELKEARFDIGK